MEPTILEYGKPYRDLQPPGDGLAGLMVGAGLSCAMYSNTMSWTTLVAKVGNLLEGAPEGSDPRDPRVIALELSWKHARNARGPASSAFQSAVVEVLQSVSLGAPSGEVSEAFIRLLRTLRIAMILDLNYDSTVENLLRQGGIPYRRAVGSEGAPAPYPLDSDTLLLWKVHGSIDAPATIVLSPTEYQRLYETNDVAELLRRCGASLESLWTVGIGLLDDDVWASLAAGPRPSSIQCIWLDDRSDDHLKSWRRLVDRGSRSVVVVKAARSQSLSQVLNSVCDYLGVPSEPRPRARTRPQVEKRWKTFDTKYADALRVGADVAVAAVAEEYRSDYLAIVDHLLCQSRKGLGPRWFPSLTPEPWLAAALGADVCEVVRRAQDLVRENVRLDGEDMRGVLVAAAAQGAIASALELAALHGIQVKTHWEEVPERIHVPKGARLVVGTSPFDENAKRVSWLRCVRLAQDVSADFSFLAVSGKGAGLLSEDEWEAAVSYRFLRSKPSIRVEDEEVLLLGDFLELCPPLYSWGFFFSDLPKFRAQFSTTSLTRYWQLVQDFSGQFQLCKGGGARDRSPRVFLLGARGQLRAGEYDEFVRWATKEV